MTEKIEFIIQGVDRGSASLRRVAGGVIALNQGLELAGKAARAAARAMNAVLGPAASFEKDMNRVKAVSGAVGAQFRALENQARQMGATTQFSASEAAKGMGFLAQAGFDTQKIISAMPATLLLAAAAQLDMASSADIVSNVMQGYGLDAKNTAKAVDVLTKAFTSSNTDLRQLGQALKFAGPVAKGFGLTFEETAAALGLMGNAGIQATMAGTGLRGALVRLASPTKEAANILKELGVNAFDAKGKMVPLNEIIGQLERSGASTTQIMEIFGQRAGPAMKVLIDQGSEALKKFTRELEKSGGTADRIAKIQMEGLAGATKRVKSIWEGFMLSIGEAGALKKSTWIMNDLAKRIGVLNDKLRDFFGLTSSAKDLKREMAEVGEEIKKIQSLIVLREADSKNLYSRIFYTQVEDLLPKLYELRREMTRLKVLEYQLSQAKKRSGAVKKAGEESKADAAALKAIINQGKIDAEMRKAAKEQAEKLADIRRAAFDERHAEISKANADDRNMLQTHMAAGIASAKAATDEEKREAEEGASWLLEVKRAGLAKQLAERESFNAKQQAMIVAYGASEAGLEGNIQAAITAVRRKAEDETLASRERANAAQLTMGVALSDAYLAQEQLANEQAADERGRAMVALGEGLALEGRMRGESDAAALANTKRVKEEELSWLKLWHETARAEALAHEQMLAGQNQAWRDVALGFLTDDFDRQRFLENESFQKKMEAARGNQELEAAQLQQHKDKMAAIDAASQALRQQQMLTAANQFAMLARVIGGKAFKIYKALAISTAIVSTYLSATKAMATIPWPMNAIVAAGLIAQGLANVAMIKKQHPAAHGGLDSVPSEQTFLLDEGERVLSPRQNRDLTGFLDAQRGGGGGGGGGGTTIVIENMSVLENVTTLDEFMRMDGRDLRELVATRFIEAFDDLDRAGVRPAFAQRGRDGR